MYQSVFYEKRSKMLHLWDDQKGYSKRRFKRKAFIPDPNGEFRSLSGTPVSRVTSWEKILEEQGLVLETNIDPATSFLVDEYLDSDDLPQEQIRMYYDIEVSRINEETREEKYSSVQDVDNQIISVCAYDTVDTKYRIWILSDKFETVERNGITLYFFTTEEEMLISFIEYMNALSPHIISGWNNDYFDNVYLVNRIIRVLGPEYAKQLSPIGILEESKEKDRWTIAGVNSLDYLFLYKKFTYTEQPRYTLDYISKMELDRGKIEYEGSLQTLYETDLDKFIEYNITDVELVVALDKKLQLIDLVCAVCHACHVPYNYIHFTSFYLTGAILTFCRRNKIALPVKKWGSDNTQAEGAFVKQPQIGLHKWIYDLDLKSLYPSIIRSFNISPETKMGKVRLWNEEKYYRQGDDVWTIDWVSGGIDSLSSADMKELLESQGFIIASNGAIYRTDVPGLLPRILEKWGDERDEAKGLMKKAKSEGNHKEEQYFNVRQMAKKIQSNSLYGVLLLRSFLFYDKDNGEAITLTGQSVIQFTTKYANHYYKKQTGLAKEYVFYTDTDSIFVSALPILKARDPDYDPDNDEFESASKKVIAVAKEVQDLINNAYDIYAKRFHNCEEHYFKIKQENVARRGFWVGAKKRYAQHIINEEGVSVNKYDFKGLDVVRSDFPSAFRVIMKQLVIDILNDKGAESISKTLQEFRSDFNDKDIEEAMKPTSVKNLAKYNPPGRTPFSFVPATPIHVKAALAYNDALATLGYTGQRGIVSGDKIMWAYIGPNRFGINAIALGFEDDPKEIVEFVRSNIDRQKIFDNILSKKVQDFFNALGWGEIVMNTSVNEFFDF